MPIFRRNSSISKNYKDIMNGNFSSINKSNVDVLDQYGNTMLHIASKKGSINLVTHLIELGANIRLENNRAQTPLDIVNNKIRKYHGKHNEYTEIAKLLIDHTDEHKNIVPFIAWKDSQKIELVFLDPNTGKQYTSETIQNQIPSSIKKIQRLTKSNNVCEPGIDKAHELYATTLSMIPLRSIEKEAPKAKVPSHVIEKNIVEYCDTPICVQERLSDQHNYNEIMPFRDRACVVNKNKSPVPPKAKNLINTNALLQKKCITEAKIDSKAQSVDNNPWHEIDQIMAEVTQYLSDEEPYLLGTDGSVQ